MSTQTDPQPFAPGASPPVPDVGRDDARSAASTRWATVLIWALACIVRLGRAAGIAADPIDILIWIPVAAAPTTVALTLAITRQIRLGIWLSTLAALCMALAPTTQLLTVRGPRIIL